MDNKVVLKMLDDKNIEVIKNCDVAFIIEKNDRRINAKMLFDLFSFDSGDTFTIDIDNPNGYDEPVISAFKDLLINIANKVNDISKEQAKDYVEN